MSWKEAQLSLQIEAELTYGSPRRRAAADAKAAENAAAEAVRQAAAQMGK